ncbi:MAG TPA: anti-sigma factor [Candidatus Solibacter sp.]|nr:anti-sigma factor [Candidatus Solibacter sp.]
MNCSRELIEGYMDEELEPAVQAEVAGHLAGCSACSQEYAQLRAQQSAIRSATYYTAPPGLEQSIRRALRDEVKADRSGAWRWVAIAATVLLAVSLAWNVAGVRRERDLLAENVVAAHVRAMIGTHLLDVESTDQHTVKPWFNGKLDFAPDVKDFAAAGFPLIGGRVDYLDGRQVAVMIYKRRQHVIELFTWPGESGKSRGTRNGFNLIHWSRGGMTYWAVSDVSSPELEQFVKQASQRVP